MSYSGPSWTSAPAAVIGLEVRRARQRDFETVADLTVAAYDAVGDMGEYREALRDVAGRATDAEVLVAVLDGEVVGSVTYTEPGSAADESLAAGDCSMRMLAVDPCDAGAVVWARALVRACLERADRRDRRRMTLYSMSFMTGAHRLYARLGFRRRPDRDVRFPSGVGLAMEYDLAPDAAHHFPAPGPRSRRATLVRGRLASRDRRRTLPVRLRRPPAGDQWREPAP